jgi:O-methyltransferase
MIANWLKHLGDISERDVSSIVQVVRPYSMVNDDGILFTILSAIEALRSERGGPIVECGVWKGGCSLAILLAQRQFFGRVIKPVYLLDSYEGLPPVQEVDGPLAVAYQANPGAPGFLDNCAASIEEVDTMLRSFGFANGADYHLIKGWFRDTVPVLAKGIDDEISVLRIDGDWYESVIDCLTHLEPKVAYGGTIILDDYYAWDGCAVATHEYLGTRKLSYRIRSMDQFAGAYFQKKHRDDPNFL